MLVADKPAAFSPKNRTEGLGKIPGRDPFQVQGRNQCVDAGYPAHILGQDLAAKSTPIAMPNPRLANLDWTYSSYQLSFRQVTVTHRTAFSRLGASITLAL